MSSSETHALGRAAALLLVASLARLALAPGPEPVQGGVGEDVLPALMAETRARTREAEARARPLEPGETLDPNQATEAELDRLPGVGPATAAAWVRTREEGGDFAHPEALLRIPGVGPKALERIRSHLAWSVPPSRPDRRGAVGGGLSRAPPPGPVVVGSGRRPVDVNRADTVVLRTLPGVGPALARRIVQARDSARFRTVDDLLRVRGIGPATLERLRPLVVVAR